MPDVKYLVAFLIVCANQVSVDWNVIVEQHVAFYAFTSIKLFT